MTVLSLLLAPFLVARPPAPDRSLAVARPVVLLDFQSDGHLEGWRSVDDTVMGGVSRSRVERASAGTMAFTGRLSLDRGGGFASVRRDTPGGVDLSAFDGLVLRVRGDGRRYQACLRTADGPSGISYQAPFSTREGEWTEVRLPFSAFVPTWRGRLLRDVPPPDASRIRSFGLMVSRKQQGAFRLEVDSVAAWRGGDR